MTMHTDPSTAPNGVLLAIDGKGGQLANPYEHATDSTWTWLHLSQNSDQARDWITHHSGIPQSEAHALIADHARPRCVQSEQGLLFIGRGVNLDEGSVPEDMKSIRVWIEPKRVITVVRRRMRSAESIAERFETGHPPSSPASVLVQLFAQMIHRIAPIVQEIGEQLDELQYTVIDDDTPTPDITELSRLRLRTVSLHRYLLPLYEASTTLCTSTLLTTHTDNPNSSDEHSVLTDANLTRDQLGRIVEELAAMEAKAAVTRDEMVSQRSEQLNDRVYRLTVLAAVFLPLTVLTGLLGMNVGGIPLASTTNGFIITSLSMLGLMGATILVLKMLKWI
ncbi:MAG: hypothetical protein JJ974_07055 [Phycisphaerales bacterium]|nr:hypothetical protein [Phycisphaerales bacterium]